MHHTDAIGGLCSVSCNGQQYCIVLACRSGNARPCHNDISTVLDIYHFAYLPKSPPAMADTDRQLPMVYCPRSPRQYYYCPRQVTWIAR